MLIYINLNLNIGKHGHAIFWFFWTAQGDFVEVKVAFR